MKINNATIAIGAVTLLGVLALVAWLTYAGRDVTQLVTLVVTLLTVAGGSAATYRKQAKTQAQVEEVAATVGAIRPLVNGNLSTLIEKATTNGHDVTEHVALINAGRDAIADAAR